MVYPIGAEVGTKMVNSALRMLALCASMGLAFGVVRLCV